MGYPEMTMNRKMPVGRSTGILHPVKGSFGGGWKHVYDREVRFWKWNDDLEGPSLCPQGETLQQISWAPGGNCFRLKFSSRRDSREDSVRTFMQALKNESTEVHSKNNKFEEILKEIGLRMKDQCEIHHLSTCLLVSHRLMALIWNPGPAEDYTPDVSQFIPGGIGHIVYEMMILRYHYAVSDKLDEIRKRSIPISKLLPATFVELLSTKKRFTTINERFLKSKLEIELSGEGGEKAYLS